MKRILLTFALAMFACGAFAQSIDRLGIEFRGDWQYDSDVSFHTKQRGSASGFSGKFANFRIDGTIADGWSYSFRYRMNKIQKLAPIHTDHLEETCQMMLALLAWKQNTH
jgi:hypothetical protein